MGSLRGVRSLPVRATGGHVASVVRGERCVIDPPNGQLWPRRGSFTPPDHDWVLPTSSFLIATACLTVSPQTGRAPISAKARAQPGSETAVGARP